MVGAPRSNSDADGAGDSLLTAALSHPGYSSPMRRGYSTLSRSVLAPKPIKRPAFSLIEVLFAITFLILVGVAMATLNNTASRLTEATELKDTALALNEQSLSFIALARRTNANFATTAPYQNCISLSAQTPPVPCYVICPVITTQSCTLQSTKAAVTIGTNKLQFTPSVLIRPTGANGRYLVNATVSWGAGVSKQLTLARIIE